MILRHRLASFTRALLLAVIGFLVASPFLTQRGVGTGEAYNYSLAVADGVTQMRAGVFPVLAGQTPFAFNGRVHPLRNAPYLIYLAGAIDVVTGHRLGFPALQNFSLAFSLLAAFFATYLALRWGTQCPPWPAAFLACVYGSSPALLAAAFSMDLYMTVHAAPFVPLALAAVARQAVRPAAANDYVLAAALSAAWWAHPPVALWLTVSAGTLRIALWLARPSWRSLGSLAGAFVVGILLAGFTFVSAFEITHYADFFNAGVRESAGFVSIVLSEVRRSFIGSVSPVSRSAGTLGDFQIGYVAWALLGLVLLHVRRHSGPGRELRIATAGLAAVALLMIGLCVPVPYLTRWMWSRFPGVFYLLTNDWPMQRLYLIALAGVILASGLALASPAGEAWSRHPLVRAAFLVLACGWMAHEAAPFVRRGFNDRWSAEVTVRNYLPSNIDLTTASYAFLEAPASSSHGVMEPWTEFRLLGAGGREPVDGNYASARAQAPVAAHGTLRRAADSGPSAVRYEPAITLEPGRHYLLDFTWRTPPFAGVLSFVGPSLQRLYVLPHAGEPESFGMSPGERTGLAISTSQSSAETVQIRVLNPTGNARDAPPPLLADFRLLAVDDAKLPVRVRSWLPLRAAVTAPADHCYVETPRCFIPGYVAIVNGRRVRPIASESGQVMLAVPAGESQIELRYEGSLLLRIAFWTSLSCWLAGGAVAGFCLRQRPRPPSTHSKSAAPRGRALAAMVTGLALLAVAGAWGWTQWRGKTAVPGTAGPLLVRLLLPKNMTARTPPSVVTGRSSAGNFIYLSFVDASHVRVGLDIWGYVRLSDPIPVDYNQDQELVVSGGMLYPPGDSAMRALTPAMAGRLRSVTRVEWNGRTVMEDARPTYDSTPASITIGSSAIGGSSVQPRFRGTILAVERLPVPLTIVRSSRPLRLELTLPPNQAGLTEPLFSTTTAAGAPAVITLKYLASARLALGLITTVGAPIEGPSCPAKPNVPHLIELTTRGRDLVATFDGSEALVLPGEGLQPGQVGLGQLGFNAAALPGILARFTGSQLSPVAPASVRATPPQAPNGAFRIVAFFPTGKTGALEPLVATGKTGRGDIVYARYADPGHIQFAYDHWGVGGSMSEPIAVDYAKPHELEIGLGSLFPERKDADWMNLPAEVRQRLRQQATVRLDGKEVWECKSPAYPSEPSDIRVGQNRIGASSCAPDFTGEILEVSRARP